MPRLNTPTYITIHYQLKYVWELDDRLFAILSQKDQLDLHKYFLFASDKTDEELIAHRRNVHQLDPSLPQRAGRALGRLRRGEISPTTYTELPDGRRISIRAIMRPEPDLRMLAKCFLQLAMNDLDMDATVRKDVDQNRAA